MTISSNDNINSSEVSSKIDELECDLSCKQDDIIEHEEEIEQYDDEIAEIEEEITALDAKTDFDEIDRLNNNIDAIKDSIDAVKGNISLVRNDIIDVKEELEPLQELQDDAEGYCGGSWHSGVILIHENNFEDYARELASDMGDINDNNWPYCHIDWEAAAEALKMDYTTVEFECTTFFFR